MTLARQKIFTQMLTSLFRAEQTVDDFFFRNRLIEAIESLMRCYIEYGAQGESLQSNSGRSYVQTFKDTEKLLEEIRYLKKGEVGALAVAHEWVVSYLLDTLQEAHSKPAEKISVPLPVVLPKVPAGIVEAKPVRPRMKNGINNNEEKILAFVRRTPECRTKEIVDEFNVLSSRTIIRCLNELSKEGLIVKKSENRATYYSAV